MPSQPDSTDRPDPGQHLRQTSSAADIQSTLVPEFAPVWSSGLSENGFADAAELLVKDALSARATDIHLDPHPDAVQIRFRVDGSLYQVARLPSSEGHQILRHLQVRAGIDAATKPDVFDGHVRLEIDDREVNLRVASIPSMCGDKLSVRILDSSQTGHEVASLGLEPDQEERLRKWMHQPSGMLLTTGPTGSGKTTTLYSILNELAKINRNIISLEDPVERALDAVTQIQVGGAMDMSFAEGLTRLLRHDPDILAVGEIRDADTARIAIDAALSGHALLSSLSARDVAGAVSLLRNLGVEDYQVCAALRVLVSQRILRLLCPGCKTSRRLNRHEKAWFAAHAQEAPDGTFESPGCGECLGTGHHGITAVFELWTPDEAGYDLILEHADEMQIRSHLRDNGVRSLRQHALQIATDGRIRLRDAMWTDEPGQAPGS